MALTRPQRITELEGQIAEALQWGNRAEAHLLGIELNALLDEERKEGAIKADRCLKASRVSPLQLN